ncbi:MAG: ribonuclease III family protein [Candidatus Thorarchaeota archaeon]
MWDRFIPHDNVRDIMNDTGLAQIGDALVNFCYSLAKSLATGKLSGEKVRDSILARAIRATDLYHLIGKRTDAGGAGDAYEALIGFLWLKGETTVEEIVQKLVAELPLENSTSRKKETEIAAYAFQKLLETLSDRLPKTKKHSHS